MESILFFMTPKSEVEYIFDDFSLRQVVEKMDYHHFSAIPVLSRDGKYVKTISFSDILYYIKEHGINNVRAAEKVNILEVEETSPNVSIGIDKTMDDLLELVINQNFVPVVDDRNYFIGIITRKAVINYLGKELKEREK